MGGSSESVSLRPAAKHRMPRSGFLQSQAHTHLATDEGVRAGGAHSTLGSRAIRKRSPRKALPFKRAQEVLVPRYVRRRRVPVASPSCRQQEAQRPLAQVVARTATLAHRQDCTPHPRTSLQRWLHELLVQVHVVVVRLAHGGCHGELQKLLAAQALDALNHIPLLRRPLCCAHTRRGPAAHVGQATLLRPPRPHSVPAVHSRRASQKE